MELRSQPIPGLAGIPLQVQAEWVIKLQATRPPDYLPLTTYNLQCTLSAEALFLVVWMNLAERGLEYFKGRRKDAAIEVEARLYYFEEWHYAEKLTLGFGGVGVGLSGPMALQTGVVYDWAIDPVYHYSKRKLLAVLRSDTENKRGRWRLKPALWDALPPYLAFLRNGRCSGVVRRPDLTNMEEYA